MKDVSNPASCIAKKVALYKEEVIALKDACLYYKLVFGLLLILLFLPFVLEILTVKLLNKDLGLFDVSEQKFQNELNEEEVPDSLKHLIPLARKFGQSDTERREQTIAGADPAQIQELIQQANANAQEIADWLAKLNDVDISVTAGYFLFLLTAAEEAENNLTSIQS